MQIYIAKSGQQTGPFSVQQIESMLNSGMIALNDASWHEGLAEWLPLHQVINVSPPVAQPAQPPPLPTTKPITQAGPPYNDYGAVPFYRRQWFFWLTYFTLTPIALGLLVFGDIYYHRRGRVKSFGVANKIVAGIIGLAWLVKIFDR